jgi:gliding motility-associated lipoprotein GldH
MIQKIVILISITILFVLNACKTDKLYEEYRTIDPSGWNKDSSAVFSFNIDKTYLNYNLFVNVRNRGDYENSNLWLFVDIKAPDFTCIHDTIEYQIAYPNGKWTGKGTGGIYTNQFPFRENVFFPIAGTYTISIRHAMRSEPLKGISDIGFGVKRR